MKHMKFIYASMILLPMLWSCNGTETTTPTQQEEVEDTYDATITIGSKTVSLDAAADSKATLTLSCDHEWSLEIPEDATWFSVNKTSGKSTEMTLLKFTATENTGAERSAVCRVLSGASKKKFTVTQNKATLVLDVSDIEDYDKYYKPQEFSNMDMLRSDATWSWCRSKQSEHAVVFWGKGYGEYGLYGERMGEENTSPSTLSTSSAYYVDIDDLLYKAELFYDMNVNTLKFVDINAGDKCCLNKYKFEIYILYQKDWLATGSGYDNVIGALWVNPSTCQPVGSTIAHEIGHSFQYMVYCDYLLRGGTDNNHGPGWRYGFDTGGDGGNCFWEQSAQWQSYQNFDSKNNYIPQAFTDYYSSGYYDCTYMHVLHEAPRYSNYFIHWWWVEAAGNDLSFIGKLWNEAEYPEDPCETYMRLMGMDDDEFNDDIWRYGAHMVGFDTEILRSYGKNYVGKVAISKGYYTTDSDGYYKISKSKCPESTGYNAVRLKGYSAGSDVTINFEGLLGESGYNCGPANNAGWRYGFVAYMTDGTSQYSEIGSDQTGTLSYTVPTGTKQLYLVVTGAPKNYERHAWGDETTNNDNRWPYRFTLEGCDLY